MRPIRLLLFLVLILFFTGNTAYVNINEPEEDFLEFWNDVKDNYAYFDKKQTDWNLVKNIYQPQAKNTNDRNQLITIFENALQELYDDHFSLNTNLKTSTRMVPTGLDVWAEFKNDKLVVTQVRKGFSAHNAGIEEGMEILAINGLPVQEAINKRMAKSIPLPGKEAKEYVVRQLLAGNYIETRTLLVKHNNKTENILLDKNEVNLADKITYSTLLDFKILKGNVGYIVFNNSLGNTEVIRKFDSALIHLQKSKALIIDLRNTPSGGNSTVARSIMSRFITKEMPYQKHLLPSEEKSYGVKRSWMEIVSPRGPFTYNKQVVILVDHWTGSMGEGIAIGFDGMKRATVIGTKMAGLQGAISGFQTTHFKIPYSFPTEQLYHVNGTPRENFTPHLLVDLTNANNKTIRDPILTKGIEFLKNNGK